MPNIIMRPATAGAEASKSKKIRLDPLPVARVLCAALAGISRFEEAKRLQIPFVLETPKAGQDADLMPRRHQLNEKLMAETAEEVLRRAYERDGKAIPDKITLQFEALSVVEDLKQQIFQHGLHVYSQKLLLDASRPLEQRLALLAAMKAADFETRRASVALATGRLPQLPAYTVADLVRSLDDTWRPVSFSLSEGIKVWIQETKPWLVEFPMPNLEAGAVARTDHFDSTDFSETAHLGLGFFLLSHWDEKDRFSIVTPTLFATRLKKQGGESKMKYSQQYHLTNRGSVTLEHRQLAELVRGPGRKKMARLEVCAKCGTIFSRDRTDLHHPAC